MRGYNGDMTRVLVIGLMVLGACDCGESVLDRVDGSVDVARDGSDNDGSSGDGSSTDGSTDGGGNLRGEVEAILTTDNAFAFGWGSDVKLLNHFSTGVPSGGADIFQCPTGGPDGAQIATAGPERFLIPAKDTGAGSFLYLIAWSDNSHSQGSLGMLRRTDGRGATILTNDPAWQVCATGEDYAHTEAPTIAKIEEHLVKCNDGSGGSESSGGWVDNAGPVTSGATGVLALGETNESKDGVFPITCTPEMDHNGWGIPSEARWMWYNPDPSMYPNPFSYTGAANVYKEFLIFRMDLGQVTVIVD